ncbi:hypothetical protein GQ457_17G009110 [Hibiscus cannabinus]
MSLIMDHSKPLISKSRINEQIQIVEYGLLPFICFHYDKYGHLQEGYPDILHATIKDDSFQLQIESDVSKSDNHFGMWMVVEHSQR